MKTRTEFLTEFFVRLEKSGFIVLPITDNDVAAEIYSEDKLFCVITQDGDIIYENHESGKARTLEQIAEETRKVKGSIIQSPFADMERMEIVTLSSGVYVKVFESVRIVLLCRNTTLYGYEFLTCQKVLDNHINRRFYREQYHYDLTTAQNAFLFRSGLSVSDIPCFSEEELSILLSYCTKSVCLDNELDSDTASRINNLMAKIESYLPLQQEVFPRHYFQDERSKGLEDNR